MADVYAPKNEAELGGFVRDAAAGNHALEICGLRSKRAMGRPLTPAAIVTVSKMSGVTLYEPNELVISARAGTPLHEVEAILAQRNQELAFEPVGLSRILGGEPLAATMGAIVAMNISGPRRILRGAARDHVIGVRAVNGSGEVIRSGGRVMKNVTGVDLVRGLSGSWGTLSVLSEVTFKVLPRAPEVRTILFLGLADEAAVGVMSAAMGAPYEVSGTIHLHAPFVARLSSADLAPANAPLTALRIEGRAQSIEHRVERLRSELAPFGETYYLDHRRSREFWADIRSLAFLSQEVERPLWRISVAPSKAPLIVRALSAFFPVNAVYEWSGGLLWLELPPSSDASVTEVRRVLAEFSADSLLMRAPRAVLSAVEVFHPLPLAKMKIVQALKQAFDPAGILNPGRMYAGV